MTFPEAEGKLTTAGQPQLQSVPKSLGDLDLPEIFLAQLLLKHCFYLDIVTLKDLGDRLKLATSIISQLVDYLVKEKCLETKGAASFEGKANLFGLTNRYAVTEGGKKRAAQLIEYDSYVGPAPVTLEAYWNQVSAQSIQFSELTMEQLERCYKGMVLGPDLLEQLGPALISGKSLFLYGPSGNGKTTIARRLEQLWEDAILIPYALYVDGHVIRLFDEINHQPAGETVAKSEAGDRRWVSCRRPLVIVGGELTVEMLELSYNPTLKYYDAPLQLKANNGIFTVDDFGRQQVLPSVLLNRWIIPLENNQDFLYLNTGQKFAIPFDQLLVFATNLDPDSLLDPAFFRRIRSKIKVRNADRFQFVEIFRLTCEHYQLDFDAGAVEYLLTEYYDCTQRPLSACHPRDLVEQILNYCRFHKLPPVLDQENLDRACRTYFVK